MYYEFMSYVAQQLQGYLEKGVSLDVTRENLIEVINKCDVSFKLSVELVSREMIAIVRESLPELKYIKNFNSDYQVQRSVTWEDYTNKRHLTTFDFKELLVESMETYDSNVSSEYLRRGANSLQGFISSSKKKEE